MDRPQFLNVHSPEGAIDVFLHLARAAHLDKRRLQADKFLLLAGVAAQSAGFTTIAERCRAMILDQTPTHMLRQYTSMADAYVAEDVRRYAEQLQAIYPSEKADYLLVRLRAAGYEGDHEFSADFGRGLSPRAQGSIRPRRKKKRKSSSPPSAAPAVEIPPDPDFAPLPFQSPLESRGSHRGTLYLVIFVVGCLLGVILGLLFAPQFMPQNGTGP